MADAVPNSALVAAAASVPSGAWLVGVSGGADSVALLRLLHARGDLCLHVAHLDHQTRAGASAVDAAFVSDLCLSLNIPCTVRRLEEVEGTARPRSRNQSSRFRLARLALFRDVVARHHLAGVVLAHHAGDQAETILHRLLRGSGPEGLTGMSADVTLAGLRVLRPLLDVSAADLRAWLRSIDQPWREDASNTSDDYARNRLRKILEARPALATYVLRLGAACRALRDWTRATAPDLRDAFACGDLADLPAPLARESARRWLAARGVPPEELAARVVDRLIGMSTDAATPPTQLFPNGVRVRRRRRVITAAAGPTIPPL